MIAAPLRILATLLLVVLDFGIGLIIGGFASMLVLLLFADTGFAWIFGAALFLVIVSTGAADRILLPERRAASDAADHRARRFAFILGFVAGTITPLIRFGILPGAVAP